MSDQFQAALARARARAEEDTHEVVRTLYGEPFTFHFLRKPTQTSVELLGEFVAITQAAGTEDVTKMKPETVIGMSNATKRFLDAMSTKETSQHLAELIEAGVIDLRDLVELVKEIVLEVGGHPFDESSGSPPLSPPAGETSTPGAPDQAWATPPTSPSIDS